MNIDPLAETSRRWSTYTYCYNNPLVFVDADGMMGEVFENLQLSENDDIIFRNNKNQELGRIVMPGKDEFINVDTDISLDKPIVVDPQAIAKEANIGEPDAVGLSIDYSGVIGGGVVGGFDFKLFLKGEDAGNVYGYKNIGGAVGFDGAIGASATLDIFNKKADTKNFNAKGMEGISNSYSGGFIFSGGYSWGNEENRSELWPGQYSTTTWETYSFGGGLGGEVGAKWSSTRSSLMNNGKPLTHLDID